jgi:hypothetical protein
VFSLWAAALAALVSLAGCGGGASSGEAGNSKPPADVITIIGNVAITCVVGVPFSETLTAKGNSAPIAWGVVPAHPLPAGLILNQATGTISGTPVLSGMAITTIVASDGNGSASEDLAFTILDRLNVSPVSPRAAHINAPYSLDFQAFGAIVSSWTISAGQLPPGLSLSTDPSVGSLAHLRGTPTQTGSFLFTVQAQDNTAPQTATLDVTIVVDSNLAISKGTLKTGIAGVPYSDTFQAVNGTLPYHWSITGLQGQALTLDGATGTLNGTPTVLAGTSYVVTVTDSSAPQQTDSFSGNLQVLVPLSVIPILPPAYINKPFLGSFQGIGGVTPYTFLVSTGSLPPGLTLSAQGFLSGTPTQLGSYDFTVQLTDSATPADVLTQQVNIQVTPTPLNIGGAPLSPAPLNVDYHSQIPVSGGTPPYTFNVIAGALPQGLSLNLSTGSIDGTPTQNGTFNFRVSVMDSSNPLQSAKTNDTISVRPGLGRNDSIATATRTGNGTQTLSISPYVDPIQSTVGNPDTDYFQLVGMGGSMVHVETFAQRSYFADSLDTVIEVLAQNGSRMSACEPPAYTSSCLNDDIDDTTVDSALDVKVPGPSNATATLYVHVLDWRGDARPDMRYNLNITGVIDPIFIGPDNLVAATLRGVQFDTQFSTNGGTGNISWNVGAGTLPPGLNLSSTGHLGGIPTVNGFYTFGITATDSGSPAQTATREYTLQIADPLVITSPATWPNACVGKPYSFQVQTSGGIPLLTFGSGFPNLPNMTFSDPYSPVFSGTPTTTGTFSGSIGVLAAAAGASAAQNVSLTVATCP